MLKKCLSLILLVQITSTWSQSSKKIDSLLSIYSAQKEDTLKVKTLISLWDLTINNNPETAEKYAHETITLAKKIKFHSGLAKGYQNLGISNLYLGNQKKSTEAYLEAIEIYKQLNDKKLIGSMYYNIGLNHKNQTQYDSAFYYNKLAENIFIALNDSTRLGSVYDQNSGLYLEQSYYQLSLQNALKAVKIFIKSGDSLRYADASTKIADSYSSLGDTLQAKKYYLEAAKIYKEKNDLIFLSQNYTKLGILLTKNPKTRDSAFKVLSNSLELSKTTNSPWYQNYAMSALGEYYVSAKEYRLAKTTFLKALEIAETNGYTFFKASSLIDLGRTDVSLNNYKVSIKHIKDGLKISEENAIIENISRANLELSKVYEKMNRQVLAFKHYKTYKRTNDSIFSLEKSRQAEELKIIYETEKKEQEIVLQDKEINLLEEKARVSTLQKLLLGGGLMLSLIAIGFGWYGFKQKTKRTKAEKETLDKALEFKKKELTTHALHLAKKNEVLESLKTKAQELKEVNENKKGYQQLIRAINFDLQDDKNWDNFSRYFEEVHQGFSTKAKQEFPNITANDLRLMALLKMNLTSKEIANILSISSEGIKKARYRLRKKLHLSTQDSLEDFILAFA